jgi:hypothetical protein
MILNKMTKEISKIAIFYGDKKNTGEYDNGCWMDILNIPFIERLEQAENYDIIIRTLWIESSIQGWSKYIRDKWPHKIQLGLSDHPLSTHISKLSADNQLAYLGDLQHLDAIMALTDEEKQFYKTLYPSKIVERVGLPFPVEKYEERYGYLRNEERQYIGLGVGAADNDRNFISNLLIFKRLKMKYPDLKGVFLSIPHQLMPYCTYMADRFEDVYIQERTGDMKDFYSMLNQCKVVINMADRNTPGRLQGECAFFKIPIVGSNRLELQNELFSATSISPYELEFATNLVDTILGNPDTGKELCEEAYAILVEEYNYEKSKERFNNILSQI